MLAPGSLSVSSVSSGRTSLTAPTVTNRNDESISTMVWRTWPPPRCWTAPRASTAEMRAMPAARSCYLCCAGPPGRDVG